MILSAIAVGSHTVLGRAELAREGSSWFFLRILLK